MSTTIPVSVFLGSDVLPAKLVATPLESACCCLLCQHLWIRCVYWEMAQVTDFPEVELRLLQKRDWRVVISQKCKFGDDMMLCEARALLRGLQVMVCAERVRNARILCLTDSMSCALAFERRRARNFKLLEQIRKLTTLCPLPPN